MPDLHALQQEQLLADAAKNLTPAHKARITRVVRGAGDPSIALRALGTHMRAGRLPDDKASVLAYAAEAERKLDNERIRND